VIVRRIASRRLMWPVEHVLPGRRGGVLEVGHENLGAGVERVDHHLAVDGPGDLGAAVLQVGGRGRDAPVRIVADVGGLREEVRQLPRIQLPLPGDAPGQQLVAAGGEFLEKSCKEGAGCGSEDFGVARADRSADFQAGEHRGGVHAKE
jgi:hypothetical protein